MLVACSTRPAKRSYRRKQTPSREKIEEALLALVVNVFVQYNDGFLPYILLLTQAPVFVLFDGTTIVYYYYTNLGGRQECPSICVS